ncbi:MAG: hypothetical protein LBJ10_05860 [Clostridiales bacterium]|jgi:hypothetical protein|nr:hypothetical protein [Clostridiales bacterium]
MADTPYREQIAGLLAAAREAIGMPIIYGQQLRDKPKNPETGETRYPFVAYAIRSAQKVAESCRAAPAEGGGAAKAWSQQWEITLGFTACSGDAFEAMEAAGALQNWLACGGQAWMRAHDMAHVASTAATARDAAIAGMYERRSGFDARLRLSREASAPAPAIEWVELPALAANNSASQGG